MTDDEGAPRDTARDEEVAQLKARVAALEGRVQAWQQIFDGSPVGMSINGPEGRFLNVNPTGLRLFGMSRNEVIGHTSIELGLLAPEDRERQQALAVHIRERGTVSNAQRVLRTKSGELRSVVLLVDRIDLGTEVRFVSTFLDVTDQKRAVERLAASEIQLREAQEVAHIGSWERDLVTNVVTRSAEYRRILGMGEQEDPPDEKQTYQKIHPDDRDRTRATFDAAVVTRQPYTLDYRIVRADGIRFIHAQGRVICDEAGTPVRSVGTAQDVTERKEIDARLLLAVRMAAVGTLTAGMAHEINNPLGAVLANLDLLAEDLGDIAGGSPSARFRELLGLIEGARKGANRVRRIVRGLKAFSRADDGRPALLNVRQILDASVNLAFHEIRHRARLVKDYREVPPVLADEGRLGQVFVSLLVNAAQAVPEGQAEKNEIRLSTGRDAAGRAVVEVRDTGSGMSREVRDRIFNPFFTTKGVGAGTGLGLSICHGVVTALGGEITVESEPGQGTVFQNRAPPAQVPEVEAGGPPAASLGSAGVAGAKRGRILVVDDDTLVGDMHAIVLKQHDVTVLTDAREARDRISEGERYDLVLCIS